MKRDELWDSVGDLESYIEVLCKAILLDKVRIINGQIKVEPLDD
jgi:hypothetical protein